MYRRFNRPSHYFRGGEEGSSSTTLKKAIVAVIVIALIVGVGVQIQKFVSCNKTGSSVKCGNGTTAVGSECIQTNFVEKCGDGLTELNGLCIKVPTLPTLPDPPTPTLPAPPTLPPIQPIPVPPPTLPNSPPVSVPGADEIVQPDPPAEEVVDPTDTQDESARPNGAPTNNGGKIAAGVVVPIAGILLVVAGILVYVFVIRPMMVARDRKRYAQIAESGSVHNRNFTSHNVDSIVEKDGTGGTGFGIGYTSQTPQSSFLSRAVDRTRSLGGWMRQGATRAQTMPAEAEVTQDPLGSGTASSSNSRSSSQSSSQSSRSSGGSGWQQADISRV